MNIEAQVCGETIEGPKVGRLIAWRKYCKRRTRHPSGRCPDHRRSDWERFVMGRET